MMSLQNKRFALLILWKSQCGIAPNAMRKVTFAVLLFALSPLSYADCEHPTEAVLKALNDYPGGKTAELATFVDCKVWPLLPPGRLLLW
jgi:hypothetical protein